jgi:hypothetical protein
MTEIAGGRCSTSAGLHTRRNRKGRRSQTAHARLRNDGSTPPAS